MERIINAQSLRDNNMGMHMSGQKTMEINYQHTIIQNMLKKVQADETDKTVKDLVWLMYDSSLLLDLHQMSQQSLLLGFIDLLNQV